MSAQSGVAIDSVVLQALDALEEIETRPLVWGLVDGSVSFQQLCELIDPKLDLALAAEKTDLYRAEDVVSELVRTGLVVEVESGAEPRYRSRMAETCRLLLRLRQLFPKHGRSPGGWQVAPTLVADFRFQRRKRKFPRRDVPLGAAIDRLTAVTGSAVVIQAIRTILGSGLPSLAGFQLRATERILRSIEEKQPLATIVCAGTASGKTLSFYLAALATVVRLKIEDPNEDWVKAIAIYPRSELLKDQLREVLGRCVALREGLAGTNASCEVRVGALFADVPRSVVEVKEAWSRRGDGFVCPFLACTCCRGEMHWLVEDIDQGRERLRCNDCGLVVDDSLLCLTRESLKRTPPDILFTTTEMLNQRLADSSMSHLFGVGRSAYKGPEMVLLDEAHTYEGRHGAQVAYVLRRWQKLVGSQLRFVGLSATLREAASFFQVLTGAAHNNVAEIAPSRDEMEHEGAEYLIALRGDPVSRSALLSTTIQTAMLLARCIDPRTTSGPSQGIFGQRTFVFTDDLDVTNRLYFDMLSAEGRGATGAPDMRRSPLGGLASLRARGSSQLRYLAGQDWRTPEILGHALGTRMVVERVSSQDRGVSSDADIVVATAALEVGVDDSTVGVVIQHKAPRGMAGFVQRKGRGGRPRRMRPWTSIVLSDYGRDRVAYQNYEAMFDPELPVRTLPTSNRYIKRMQAVYATMDYLGTRAQTSGVGSVWLELAGHRTSRSRRDRLILEIEAVLGSDAGTSRLAKFLRSALRLPEAEVSALLWEYPRPLMTTVLPTALRRLRSTWSAGGRKNADSLVVNSPLPEFIPSTLFADLSLAEVKIELPFLVQARSSENYAMQLFSAMRELAPGRVSRRFGVRSRVGLWVASDFPEMLSQAITVLEIDTFSRTFELGSFAMFEGEAVVRVPVVRPMQLSPRAVPNEVSDTSQGRLTWLSQLVPQAPPVWLRPPNGTVWERLIPRLALFLHAQHSSVEVRRFSLGSRAEISLRTGEKHVHEYRFGRQGSPVALGGSYCADGVMFEIEVPTELFAVGPENAEKWRALRTSRFMDMAKQGLILPTVSNPFAREWIAHIFLSALTVEAVDKNNDLQRASETLFEGTAGISLQHALSILFQSQALDTDEVTHPGEEKLRAELQLLLSDPGVVDELRRGATCLWEPASIEWEPWLKEGYTATLAAALLRAICDLCPTIEPEDLVVDIGRGPSENDLIGATDRSEVWITERSPGGNGQLEEFAQRYSEDPRRYFSLVRAALEMGEFELVDHQLSRLVDLLALGTDFDLTRIIRELRGVNDPIKLDLNMRQLRTALVREGLSPFHGFIAAISTRLLRGGSGPASDSFIKDAIDRWSAQEARLGVEIDLRVVCYWLSQSPSIEHVLRDSGIDFGADPKPWRMGAIQGLLWPRGRAVRQPALVLRSQYFDVSPIERHLVLDTIIEDRTKIAVNEPDWLSKTAELLSSGRLVTLVVASHQRCLLGDALNALITNSIDSGYLRSYARLQAVRQTGSHVEADIELAEAAQ